MDLAMGGAAALVAGAFVCRLDLLHVRTARAVAIVLHLAGLGIALWVMAWALAGRQPGALGWLVLGVAASWISGTWREWRHGVPAWARK